MNSSRERAFRVAAIYAVFGLLWIAVSDRLLVALVRNGEAQTLVQTCKGWVFVLVTAALVFCLARRALEESERLTDTLKRSEERYHSLFENMLEGYAYCQVLFEGGTPRDFVYLDVNNAFETLTGLKQVVGKKVSEVIPGIQKTNPELFEIYGRVALTGKPERFETYVDALGIWFSIAVYSPHKEHFVAIFDNITERKKTEEQLRQAQKMEAVGLLAGGVAHDFNNILSAIIGYSHLMLMKLPGDDPLRHYLDQILESSDRATVLTQSLLAFGRRQMVNLAAIDLNAVVGGFEKFLMRVIREDITLTIAPAREPLTVMADRGQIEQVIMNLVTNARDAMPDGGRLVIETRPVSLDRSFIETHGYGKAGEYALVLVSDTGTGMDEQTQARVFEPFFTTKEQGKGTGLGLSVVYGIVKKHDGFIDVYSEPGQGTTFKIYLPRVRVAAEPGAGKPGTPAAPRGGTETILVAEDDGALRRLNTETLTQFGYTVIEAVDGADAVAKFMENKDSVRLVILDGIMPRMNGKEVFRKIREASPGVRCIFMSGYAEDIFTKGGMPDGEADFVLKPVSPRLLLAKVREVLDRQAEEGA